MEVFEIKRQKPFVTKKLAKFFDYYLHLVQIYHTPATPAFNTGQ